MKCPNKSHKDWKEISARIGEKETMRVYLANDGEIPLPDHPVVSEIEKKLKENPLKEQLSDKAEELLKPQLKAFFNKIGVKVERVDSIKDRNGNPLSYAAESDLINRTVRYVEGKIDQTTLPEEAGHMFVAFLPTDHPLYKSMYANISNFKVYQDARQESPEYDEDSVRIEAMGKLIGQIITSKSNESLDNTRRARNWLKIILDYVKELLRGISSNDTQQMLIDYDKAAGMIMNLDIEALQPEITPTGRTIYYQKTNTGMGQEAANAAFAALNVRFEKPTNINGDTRYKDLTKNKKEVEKRVSDFTHSNFEKKMGKDVAQKYNESPRSKALAEVGTEGHKLLQEIVISLDKSEKPKNTSKIFDDKQYEILVNSAKIILSEAQAIQNEVDKTKKFTVYPEQTLYDEQRDLIGSADLIITLSDGRHLRYDYKFINLRMEDDKVIGEIPWSKQESFENAGVIYDRLIEKVTGGPVIRSRTIPANIQLKYDKLQKKVVPRVASLEMMDYTKDYLIPIPTSTEEADSENLNKFVKQLRTVEANLNIDVKKTHGDLKLKTQAEHLRKVIKELLVKKEAAVLLKEVQFIVDNATERLAIKDELHQNYLTDPELLTAQKDLQVYENIVSVAKELTNQIEDPKLKEQQKNNIFLLAGKLNELQVDILGEFLSRAQKKANKEAGGADLSKAQEEFGFFDAWFTYLSDQEHPIFRTANTYIRKLHSNNLKEEKALFKEIQDKVENLDKWAESKGLTRQQAYDRIINPNNGNLITRFKQDFWDKKEKAQEGEDIKWLKANLEFSAEDKVRYNKAKEREFKKLEGLFSDKEFLERKQKEWELMYNPENKSAWFHKGYQYLSVKKDAETKWKSDEWKFMESSENKPLMDFYEMHYNKMKDWAESLGIKWKGHYTANVRKEMIDQIFENGLAGLTNMPASFLASLNAYEGEWGKTTYIDPVTNKPKFSAPLLFTEPFFKDSKIDTTIKSKDIASSLFMFGKMAINHRNVSEIQDSMLMLQELLNPIHKEQLRESSGPEWKKKLEKIIGNSDSYEEFTRQLNYHLFGQSLQGSVSGKFVKGTKIAQKAMSFHRNLALPLNLVGALGSAVSASANAYFNSVKGTHFTNQQFREAMKSTGFDTKQKALNDFFEATMQDLSERRALKLSASKKKYINNDNMYFFWRKPDELLEESVMGAMARNYGIKDGIPVRLEFLKDAKSLYELFTVNKDGSANITELSEDGFAMFRQMIIKEMGSIRGGTSKEDIMGIKTNIIGQILMQYKTWMPSMFYERFRSTKFDDTFREVQIGRYRALFGETTGAFREATKKIKHDKELGVITPTEIVIEYSKALLKTVGESIKIISEAGTLGLIGKKGMNKELAEVYFQKWLADNPNMDKRGMTDDQLRERFLSERKGQIRAAIAEVRVGLIFLALMMLMLGDWDDDKEPDYKKYAATKVLYKIFQRAQMEMSFFYSPFQLMNLWESPVPILGIGSLGYKTVSNMLDELRDSVVGENVDYDPTPPLHYFFQWTPVRPLIRLFEGEKQLQKLQEYQEVESDE